MTATQLASAVRNHADIKIAQEPRPVSEPESYIIGWLTVGLEDAYEVLMRCKDPAAKTFLAAIKRRHATRVDCGSGHDYGICPKCKEGHGHVVMRDGIVLEHSAPMPL